jgi:tetratricopeptide (TPR) repeat protein
MKRVALIFILSILSLLYYMGVLTGQDTLPLSDEFLSAETSSSDGQALDLREVWSSRLPRGGPNPPNLSVQELDQIYELKVDRGIRNLPVLSLYLIREGKRARRKGDDERAVQLATYAVKFSPELPQSHFELAKARFRRSPLRIHEAFSPMVRGLLAQFRYYPSSLRTFYDAFYIFSNAMFMTFIIFGLVVLIKYLPLYVYDIQKNLTQEVSRLLLNGLKIFVFFIPLFLRLDILWAILFWTVLLWGYVSKRERQLIFIFFVVLVYFPFLLRSSSSVLNRSSSEIILEMHRANYENWDRSTEQKLRAWLSVESNDSDVLFTYGLMEKRLGGYGEAEKFYQRAISHDPKFSEAYSNLGNVYLARKEPKVAIDAYQKAVDLNAGRASYYYNLYRAYSQETFLSRKSDEAFKKARYLDPNLIDYYLTLDKANKSPGINRLVIDEPLSAWRLWKRLVGQVIGREGGLFLLFRAWFEKIPSRVGFLMPVLFLGLIVGMSKYARAKRFLTRCPMCGSPTYRFYLGASDQEFICFNCYRIFIQKEKLHPKIVEKKSLQTKEFQVQNDRVSRFLSYVFVGYGYVWKGYFGRGLLSLLAFFILILRFVYWNGVVAPPFAVASFSIWKVLFWGGLFILLYVITLRQIRRLRPRFGKGPRTV